MFLVVELHCPVCIALANSSPLQHRNESISTSSSPASLRSKRFCAVREQRITGRPIFRAGKTPKTPFFALCSMETLATQAITSLRAGRCKMCPTWPSIKSGTWNILEHSETIRNILRPRLRVPNSNLWPRLSASGQLHGNPSNITFNLNY